MRRVIPQSKYRMAYVIFKTKLAHACGAKREKFSAAGRKTEPSRGQHSQEVPARKYQHVAGHCPHAGEHPIRASAHLRRTFPARATVPKELPAWCLGVNVNRLASLVFTVIPFDQVRVDLGSSAESRQFASMSGAFQWTGKYFGELEIGKALADAASFLFALLRERQIGKTGVLASPAPGCFTMADEINHWQCIVHSWGAE